MENCLYQGNTICSLELKDDSGLYDEDLVLEWKQAAADRLLYCVECGAPVYLAAGMVKEPYFAHYDSMDCDYGNWHESEELKKGKHLLYRLMKRSFPGIEILARYKMENGMYSTLYCEYKEGTALAVDYRLQNSSLEKFRIRDAFYQSKLMKPIYILGIRQLKDLKQIDWYQNLLQNSMGYLVFLDTQKECITLKKSFGYRLGRVRYIKCCVKTYFIKELALDTDGQMLCDFSEACEQMENLIIKEKNQYDNRRKQLQSLSEEQNRLIEIDNKRLEEYRKSKEMIDISIGRPTLDPVLLEKCRKLISEGKAQLVARKYYDAIMSERD